MYKKKQQQTSTHKIYNFTPKTVKCGRENCSLFVWLWNCTCKVHRQIAVCSHGWCLSRLSLCEVQQEEEGYFLIFFILIWKNEWTKWTEQYRLHTHTHTHTIRSLIYGLQSCLDYYKFIPFINQVEVEGIL